MYLGKQFCHGKYRGWGRSEQPPPPPLLGKEGVAAKINMLYKVIFLKLICAFVTIMNVFLKYILDRKQI